MTTAEHPLLNLAMRYPGIALFAVLLLGPGASAGVSWFTGPNSAQLSNQVSENVRASVVAVLTPEINALSDRIDAKIDGLEDILTERISSSSQLQDERYKNQGTRIDELSNRIDEHSHKLSTVQDKVDTNRSNYRALRNSFYTEHTESGVHKTPRPASGLSVLPQLERRVAITHGERHEDDRD